MMYPVPMPGRLLIEEFAEKTITDSGLFLTSDPDASIYQGHGVVRSVGDFYGYSDCPHCHKEIKPRPEFQMDDEIYYNNNSGSLVKLQGKEYLVIKEDSVLVKMVKE